MTVTPPEMSLSLQPASHQQVVSHWRTLTQQGNALVDAGDFEQGAIAHHAATQCALGHLAGSLFHLPTTDAATALVVISVGNIVDTIENDRPHKRAVSAISNTLDSFESIMCAEQLDHTVKMTVAKHVPRLQMCLSRASEQDAFIKAKLYALFAVTQRAARESLDKVTH
jgi:hypothetical protein